MSRYQFSHYCVDGNFVDTRVAVPRDFFARAKGLIGRKSLESDEAMLFYNCSSIHMIGMRFSIDVVYLNEKLVITKLVEALKPWWFSGCRSATHTLELSQGSISKNNLAVGQKIEFIGH